MDTLFKQERKRRSNGRFATPQQAHNDKLKRENERLRYDNEMLRRKLEVFERGVLRREII